MANLISFLLLYVLFYFNFLKKFKMSFSFYYLHFILIQVNLTFEGQ